jgi:hypothetical protein
MYDWKHPNKIILTEYICQNYTDFNMVFQSYERVSDVWHKKWEVLNIIYYANFYFKKFANKIHVKYRLQ